MAMDPQMMAMMQAQGGGGPQAQGGPPSPDIPHGKGHKRTKHKGKGRKGKGRKHHG